MDELIIKLDDADLVAAMHSDLAGAGLPMPFEQDVFLYGTEIVGISHRENIPQLYESLNEGDLVTLIREPQNRVDEYAIRVDVDADGIPGYDPAKTDLNDKRTMLGYIPRMYNKVFARLMDAGKLLYGKVRLKENIRDNYRIVIKIYMRD